MKGKRLPRSSAPRHSLWRLIAGPATWALHFLLCYVTVAIHCAKAVEDAPLGGSRIALWIYTLLAIAIIAAFGWRGWRAHRVGERPLPHDVEPQDSGIHDARSHGATAHGASSHDAATATGRNRFLGFVTLLLCVLAATAVGYTAFAILVIGTCR